MYQMGGMVVNLTTRRQPAGPRRADRGQARVISRMVDIVMIRTFEQTKIERFAANSRVPVINGLTNEFHPCQILADLFTYIELRGAIAGKTVAWVGDGNNMANTWLQARRHPRLQIARESTPSGYSSTRWPASEHAPCVKLFAIRWTPAAAPTSSPPTCGPAWATKPRTKCRKKVDFAEVVRRLRDDGASPSPTPCSCTACPRTAARK
jgi:ornithine carbamoyltransferase